MAAGPGARFAGLAAAALLLAVALTHGGAVRAGFMWLDDALYVTDNLQVLAGLRWEGVAWAFGAGDGRDTYFHPLTWLSLMADVSLFGPDPAALHLENLLLHAATAFLLFLLAARTTGARWAALAAALLFAVHPLTVEGVAWIVERKTVLATSLGLGAALAWVERLRRPAGWKLALSALLLALSILSRPQLVVLPVLLLVLDVWPLCRLGPAADPAGGGPFRPAPLRTLLLEKWPLAAVSAAGAAAVLTWLPRATDAGPIPRPLGLRAANAVASLADYLGAVAWPRALTVLRPFPAEVGAGELLLGAGLLVLLSAGALLSARRRPWLLAGWLWFLVALGPAAGLVQTGFWPAWADRFAYAPLLGLSLAVAFEGAALAALAPRARAAVLAAVVVALLALGLATRAQVEHWQSSVSLFQRAAAAAPGSAALRTMYASTLMNERRHAEALAELEAALRLDPGHALARLRVAETLHELGRPAAAAEAYRAALRLDPDDPMAHFGLGYLAWQEGWSDVARVHLTRFLAVHTPDARRLDRFARRYLEGIRAAPPGTPMAQP